MINEDALVKLIDEYNKAFANLLLIIEELNQRVENLEAVKEPK